MEDRQLKMLQQRKEILIEKRRRRAEREAVQEEVVHAAPAALPEQAETAGALAATI